MKTIEKTKEISFQKLEKYSEEILTKYLKDATNCPINLAKVRGILEIKTYMKKFN